MRFPTFDYKRLKNQNGYHETELWPLYIGERVKNLAKDELLEGMAEATREILERLPADIVIASVNSLLDGVITVGTVTRPMAFSINEGETFMSTTPLSFPDYAQKNQIIFLPPTSVARVSPDGINILSTSLRDTRVEQIDFRTARLVREDMEKRLKTGVENAISIYDLPFYTEWGDFWQQPKIDSKFQNQASSLPLKPFASLIYEGLWSFHKEGRLRTVLGTRKQSGKSEKRILKFYLEE